MTEISRPWSGTTPGDAGPYTDQNWSDIWEAVFGGNQANKGVLALFGADFAISGSSSPLTVGAGTAFVNGRFYNSNANTSVTIPTPVTATRLDRIVLRVSWSAQTVRITRVAGSEGGVAPALTQTDGTTWDIPLWKVSITTGAAITITDEREFVWANALPPLGMGGRLTLTSGISVTTADVTGAGTIYYTPDPTKHNRVLLPTASSGSYGTGFASIEFSETSLALVLTANKNYDVFGYYNNGALALELSAAWTNDTTRADAVTLVRGLYVKSSNNSRVLLGTIRASGTNTTEDSITKRFVSNLYNAVERPFYRTASPSLTFPLNTTDYWNADSTYKFEFVQCQTNGLITADGYGADAQAQPLRYFVGPLFGLDTYDSANYAAASRITPAGYPTTLATFGSFETYATAGYHFIGCGYKLRGDSAGTWTLYLSATGRILN